jgi:hypothetical protein
MGSKSSRVLVIGIVLPALVLFAILLRAIERRKLEGQTLEGQTFEEGNSADRSGNEAIHPASREGIEKPIESPSVHASDDGAHRACYPDLSTSDGIDAATPESHAHPPEELPSLRFGEIFKSPIGRRGLEYTDKARFLDRKSVRVAGYMVHQCDPTPGVFLLAPGRFALHEHEYGLCDDLPASTIHVHMPEDDRASPPVFTPQPLLLTGTLRLGSQAEPDGRISTVRLQLRSREPGMKSAVENEARQDFESAIPPSSSEESRRHKAPHHEH